MSAETVTYALLAGAGPVTAIVGSRIFPVILPEKQPTPALVYTLISSPRRGAIDAYAPTHLTQSRVQIDVMSADHAVSATLRDAVVAAMQFQRGVIGGTTVHSVIPAEPLDGPVFYDKDLRLFVRPLDFFIFHEGN